MNTETARATSVFFVIALFDQKGYHSSVTAPTENEVKAKAATRTILVKNLGSCTCPFLGVYTNGLVGPIKDVSLPSEFRKDFAALDHQEEES